MELTEKNKKALIEVARASIDRGLKEDRALEPVADEFDGALKKKGASFVTIKLAGQLRGCIGTLEAHRSLLEDVAQNAYNAAFGDPRFSPVIASESALLKIHISILTSPESFSVKDEADLFAQLEAGVTGLVLIEGTRKATFLPSVWDSLPEPARFLSELLRKAGLPPDHWSDKLQFQRYRVIDIA